MNNSVSLDKQPAASGEFSIIDRYFNRKPTARHDVKLAIGDDCALVSIKEQQWVAISTDTLIENVHFLPGTAPEDIAYKALAVNLSDLAAMGADPAWVSLALTLPAIDHDWLQRFSDSLLAQLTYYDTQLIGGNTTKGQLNITLTIQGLVPAHTALTRSGAKNGDWLYVTGTLGDSAAGLALLKSQWQLDNQQAKNYFIQRHLRPQARVLIGQALRQLASAAIDISDGLAADLSKLLAASRQGAYLHLDQLPLSAPMRHYVTAPQAQQWALSGGEDYELCFTVPEIHRTAVDTTLNRLGVPYCCIGQISSKVPQIQFLQNQQPVTVAYQGYDHFA